MDEVEKEASLALAQKQKFTALYDTKLSEVKKLKSQLESEKTNNNQMRKEIEQLKASLNEIEQTLLEI